MTKPRSITFNFKPELFHPKFLPYFEAKQSIQLYVGTAGSGKSEFNYQRAIIFALTKKYFRFIYSRKNATTIRDSVFQGFKDLIREWNLEQYFQIKESEMDIICKLNGNMLLSFGLDDPTKLKSIKDPTHAMVEEMTEVDFDDFAQLQLRLRTDKSSTLQFWGMFNPIYGFWGRDYFFSDNETDEIPMGEVPAKTNDTLILKTTYKDNPFIDREKYEQKILELAHGDQNKLIVYGEGNWGSVQTGNEYFTKFNKAIHVSKVAFIKGKPIHLTYDINSLPYMTELCSQINITTTEFQIRLFKEYCLKSPFNTKEAVCKAFLDDYEIFITDLLLYGDASGNNRIPGEGDTTSFDAIKKALNKYLTTASIRFLKYNPAVLRRRDFMNDLFAGKIYYQELKVVLLIDENCKETIKDMLQLKLGAEGKLKKRVTDKKTGLSWEEFGHCADGLEYFCIRLLWDIFKTYLKTK